MMTMLQSNAFMNMLLRDRRTCVRIGQGFVTATREFT